MKKVDLHMHTVSTVSDHNFTFSMDTLKRYVESRQLDCIAITNHNMFDSNQFEEIDKSISTTVLPGIEIDLEGGHLLLISDKKELHNFKRKCDRIAEEVPTEVDSIDVAKLVEIFPDLSNYILIPHYSKSPIVKEETLSKLSRHVTAGEVTSPKKFKYCLNDKDALVPVLSGDLRMKENLSKFPTRQTYLDIGELSHSAIKIALRDKNKVFLSEKEGHKFFDALENGLKLSTGLNVIIGERSTGKSFTLDRIYDEHENVKYIRQFHLLERDEDADRKRFDELLSSKQSVFTRDYLKELQAVVEDVAYIDLENDERSIEQYVRTLIKSGYEAEKADAYSKAQLFNESKFEDSDISNLKSLIDSTVRLIENIEYRELIDRHVSIVTLQGLAVDLMRKYVDEAAKNRKKQYVNDLIDTVRSELRMHTAATPVEDVDLYQKALNRKKVEKFEEVVNAAKSDEEIYRKEIQGYVISATRRRFSGAQELKNVSRKMLSFSEAFASYDSPYAFLKALREIEGLEEAEYYKFFVKLEYQVLNKHGYKVSGGERSEFRLLQEINDAQQFDMLLIDEPESSFDNIFLMSQVNQLIKDISKNMPVAIVTHNSTVGASIKPDYVVYTSKTIEDGCVSYELYSGYPSDKYLRGLQGNQVRNHEALMNCLEAGEEAYKDRGASYEILKD